MFADIVAQLSLVLAWITMILSLGCDLFPSSEDTVMRPLSTSKGLWFATGLLRNAKRTILMTALPVRYYSALKSQTTDTMISEGVHRHFDHLLEPTFVHAAHDLNG